MKLIPTKVHGVLDYLSGATLIASPWLFNFANNAPARRIAVGVGATFIGQSLFTDYELGVVKQLPMPAHLTLDVLGGVLLTASPQLFGFTRQVRWPHVALGVLSIGAGLLTQRSPSYAKTMPTK